MATLASRNLRTTFQSSWSNLDQRTFVAPAGAAGGPPITVTAAGPGGGIVGATVTPTPTATVLGTNGTGTAKIDPYMLNSFMRLYFGADAMATNGLRYGAGIELRENFPGFVGTNSNTGSSGYSSSNTVFVRRAFTYAAGENWGLFRLGMADGVIGIFDNGVTSGQFLINGFGGGDLRLISGPGSVLLPVHAGRRIRQHESGLSVTADRRLRLRHPVGAERVERHCRAGRHRRRLSAPASTAPA